MRDKGGGITEDIAGFNKEVFLKFDDEFIGITARTKITLDVKRKRPTLIFRGPTPNECHTIEVKSESIAKAMFYRIQLILEKEFSLYDMTLFMKDTGKTDFKTWIEGFEQRFYEAFPDQRT
jgi:hypothetical protein